MLEVYSFGGLRLYLNGEVLSELSTRKVEALCVYLISTGRTHPREVLAEMLWEERSLARATSSLRVALTNLRKNLGPYFVIDRETVSFNPESNVWFDVTQFETLLKSVRDRDDTEALSREEADHLAEAVDLYQGEFLEGFFVRDASQFEAWVTVESERLHRLVVDAFAKLVSLHIDQGQYAEGVEQAARWLQLDPMMEKAHRQMMRLLAFSGRPGEALRQYAECVRVLDDELGLAPSHKTVALYEAI